MKRVLLFLFLAAGGLAAVWATAGPTPPPPEPRPRTATSPGAQTTAGPRGAAHDTRDLPIGKGAPPARVDATGRVSLQAHPEAASWLGPLGQRLDFPAFVPWDFEAASTEAVKKVESGDSGIVARFVRLRVYRSPKDYDEETARTLHADREGRHGPVDLEVTADAAQGDFLHLGVAGGERIPGVRTLATLEGNCLIKDIAGDRLIRTERAYVDIDRNLVWGDGPLVAESPISREAVPDWRLDGVGFRMEGQESRQQVQMRALTIQRDVDLDVRRMAAGMSAAPSTSLEPGRSDFHPTRVRSRGPAVLSRSAPGGPAYRVVLEKDVHVDEDEGTSLFAQRMTLDFEPAPRPGGAPAAGRPPIRLHSLLAEVDVHVRNSGPGAGPVPGGGPGLGGGTGALEILSPRMTSIFAAEGKVGTTTFEGHTTLVYEGDVSPIGREARAGTVNAVCEDRMTLGPPATPRPRVGAALSLIGRAHVQSRSGEETPQTIDGDEIVLWMPAASSGAAADPKARRRLVGFEARRNVRLDGPMITGVADLLVGRDLDLPTFLVTAEGRGARLAVAENAGEPTPKGSPAAGAAPAAEAKAKAPKRSWAPESLMGRGSVTAQVHADTASGLQRITLEGETLDYGRETGGRLRGGAGRDARMGMPGEGGRDGSIHAPLIGFAFGADERSLWTDGRTEAVVWTGEAPAAAAAKARSPRGVERFGARSETKIEIQGLPSPDDSPTIAVRVHDGGALERFEGDVVADRIQATEISTTLVERVAVPGEASLFGPSPRTPAGAGATAKAPERRSSAKPPEPERWRLSSARRLALRFADTSGAMGGLRSLEAEGAVDARSDTLRLEGERLAIDGATSEVDLVAAPGKYVRVTSGRETDGPLQKIVSSKGRFTIDRDKAGGIRTANFAPPVAGSMTDVDAKTGRASKVLLVSRSGALVFVDGRATVDAGSDFVTATMSRKEPGEKEFGPPITLTTPRLVIEPASTPTAPKGPPAPKGPKAAAPPVKGAQPPPFDRLTAEGPGTRLDIAGAQGGGLTRALGKKIVYDGKASRVTISTDPGKRVYLVRDGLEASFLTLTYDPVSDSWDTVGADAEIESAMPLNSAPKKDKK